MKLSLVATLYRSAVYVEDFHRRATAAARAFAGDDYEIVLVNDGSPDDSLERARKLTEVDQHVVVVDLSRNFGHHKAMMTGLEFAEGDLIFLIDSDLEEEPEWLPDFYQVMAAERADVVYGVQRTRKGSITERWSGEIYYTLLELLSSVKHPRNITTARLMSRRYVNALLRHRENEVVISFLWIITGFKQCAYTVDKHGTSKTTYSLTKKLAHFTNSITSFSEVPLRFIFYIGALILVCSLAYSGHLAFTRVFLSHPVDGWTSVMVSIWVLGGMVISFVGIIGIYLSKVFSETKQRPFTIVREVHGRSGSRDR
ncbi:glycosyltransferase family 2 protein [Thiocapsa roseopersicina]|uniref:Putative glycosyltransferase n=1 Tax=Thiocapsa roseopersicina TaxID=1058 RepID=A0A1H2QCS5_THIRO|nr:glycosyltransferase family 2 protein [Thiocapsa roseopersicina]SDW04932.1 putative glycosyltransferase [Thiocapsa roseopersicina]